MEFTCAACRGTFDSGWTEEEARAEFAREFPGVPFNPKTTAELCDDCFAKFQRWRSGLLPAEEARLARGAADEARG